jgi:hypothetical protein
MKDSFATPERQYRWRVENAHAYRGRAVNIRLLKCERCGDPPDAGLVAKTLTLCLRCLYAYSAKVRELEAMESLESDDTDG